MAETAETHVNAYLTELQEAETQLVQQQGRVAGLRQNIADRFGKKYLPKPEENVDPALKQAVKKGPAVSPGKKPATTKQDRTTLPQLKDQNDKPRQSSNDKKDNK
jgi:hypothetical protein